MCRIRGSLTDGSRGRGGRGRGSGCGLLKLGTRVGVGLAGFARPSCRGSTLGTFTDSVHLARSRARPRRRGGGRCRAGLRTGPSRSDFYPRGDRIACRLGCGEPIDWDSVEERLGLALPHDYKEYASLCHALLIEEFLKVFHPSGSNGYFNFFESGLRETEMLRDRRRDFPEEVPFDGFPDLGGLLCWGSTGNGDSCFWKTDEDPEKWSVVVFDKSQHRLCPGGVVEFLAAVLDRAEICPLFPENFPDAEPCFAQVP